MNKELLQVISNLAQNQEIVNSLKLAIGNETILTLCPFKHDCSFYGFNNLCINVCSAIWPDLEGTCPCHKVNRKKIVEIIVSLNETIQKLFPIVKEGSILRVTYLHGRIDTGVVIQCDSGKFIFSKDGNRWFDPIPCKKQPLTKEEVYSLLDGGVIEIEVIGTLKDLLNKKGE